MKKTLIYFATLIGLTTLFASCQEEKKLPVASINSVYSDTTSLKQLLLTYSDEEMLGKQVTVESKDGKTAKLTLAGLNLLGEELPLCGVVPGEAETVLNVKLEVINDKTYSFEGNADNADRKLSYNGILSENELKLDLDVTFDNALVGTKWELRDVALNESKDKFLDHPVHFNWTSGTPLAPGVLNWTPEMIFNLLAVIPIFNDMTLDQALDNSLRSVQFRADGNIVAEYSDMENIASPVWENLDLNIAQYYVKDNKMYLTLSVAGIVEAVTKAEGEFNIEPAMPGIMQLIPMLKNGLPLEFVKKDDKMDLFLNTDFCKGIILDKIVLPLLQDKGNIQYIQQTLTELAPDLAPMVIMIINSVPKVIETTTVCELGLNLSNVPSNVW